MNFLTLYCLYSVFVLFFFKGQTSPGLQACASPVNFEYWVIVGRCETVFKWIYLNRRIQQ